MAPRVASAALLVVLGSCRHPPARWIEPPRAPLASVADVGVSRDVSAVVDAPGEVLATTPASALPPAVPAFDAVLEGRRLVVLEPTLDALRAVDVVTGEDLWRVPLPPPPGGTASVNLLGEGRVLVHRGNQLTAVDLASGSVLGQHQGLWSTGDERAGLALEHGACAIRRGCALQTIDCRGARPLGPIFHGREVHIYAHGEAGHSTGCWGHEPELLGRAGSVVLVLADYPDHSPTPLLQPRDLAPRVFALDAATGSVRYTLTLPPDANVVTDGHGASPDGRTCWLAFGAGAVRAFSCASGRVLWNARSPASDAGDRSVRWTGWAPGSPPGIFVLDEARSWVLDPASGAVRWSRGTTPEVHVVPGLRVGDPLLLPSGARTLVLSGSGDGREVARGALPEPGYLEAHGEGGLAVSGTDLAWDVDGRPLSRPSSVEEVLRVRRADPSHGEPGASVWGPGDTLLARLDTDAWSLGRHEEGGITRVAVFVWHRDRPGEVRVFSITAR